LKALPVRAKIRANRRLVMGALAKDGGVKLSHGKITSIGKDAN
jgi:hypothetical protein